MLIDDEENDAPFLNGIKFLGNLAFICLIVAALTGPGIMVLIELYKKTA